MILVWNKTCVKNEYYCTMNINWNFVWIFIKILYNNEEILKYKIEHSRIIRGLKRVIYYRWWFNPLH